MSKRYYEENFKKQLVNIYNQGNHTYQTEDKILSFTANE